MKKWQNEKSEKSEEISEKLFRVFLFPSCWFCPTAKIENSDLKFLEKYFQDFWDFRGFQAFHLALSAVNNFHKKLNVVNTLLQFAFCSIFSKSFKLYECNFLKSF